MTTIYDTTPSELIHRAAGELKKSTHVQVTEWAKVVKTGAGQERPPVDIDWWYLRAASILRKIYLRGPIGVSKLRYFYGKKKNRGVKPERFYKSGGKIVRTILQQLEAEGLVKKAEKGARKGKIITPKGQAFLDNIAHGDRRTKKTETARTAKGALPKADPGTVSDAGTA